MRLRLRYQSKPVRLRACGVVVSSRASVCQPAKAAPVPTTLSEADAITVRVEEEFDAGSVQGIEDPLRAFPGARLAAFLAPVRHRRARARAPRASVNSFAIVSQVTPAMLPAGGTLSITLGAFGAARLPLTANITSLTFAIDVAAARTLNGGRGNSLFNRVTWQSVELVLGGQTIATANDFELPCAAYADQRSEW